MTDASLTSLSPPQRDPHAAAARADRFAAIERAARLWSGVILFVFVLAHLMNHAVGILGVDAMEAVQVWRTGITRTWAGTVILYGAAGVHILLVAKRIVSRRTWRMPMQEAIQIALGLAIPVLLYEHAIGTRYVASFAGVNDTYAATLLHLYPGKFLAQTALVLVVWVHGVIGIRYAIRVKPWYRRYRELLLVLAVLVPVLGIAGFVAGAREAMEIGHEGANWSAGQREVFIEAARWVNLGLFAFAGALVVGIGGLAATRRFGQKVPVRYSGHGLIKMPRGSTLLEASRQNSIPHPSLCGGRARCSTCRVLVKEGGETLPEPSPIEAMMLKRIAAPARVRLACQIRPTAPLKVRILLPLDTVGTEGDLGEANLEMGVQRDASVLFVDLRAFSKLAETQLPYDLVVLLNRFVGEMRNAIESHNGKVTMYLSDGLMAVFGLNGENDKGSRNALATSRAMLRAIEAMNEELHAALTIPIRIGIGIHTGPVVMARIGEDDHGFTTTALGESVSIASRLQDATKSVLADCLISDATFVASGRTVGRAGTHKVHVPGRAEPITAYSLRTDGAGDATGSDDGDTDRDAAEVQDGNPGTAPPQKPSSLQPA